MRTTLEKALEQYPAPIVEGRGEKLKEFNKPINAKQIKRIETLRHALAIEDDWFKNYLLKAWGVDSSEKLKGIEAKLTIWEMEDVAICRGTLHHLPLSEERKRQKTSLVIVLEALKLEKMRKLKKKQRGACHE